jgi:hypothetical protein
MKYFVILIVTVLFISCDSNDKASSKKNLNDKTMKTDLEFKLSGGAPSGGEYIPVSKTHIGYKLNGKVEAETQILEDGDVLYWYDGEDLKEINLMDIKDLNSTVFKRETKNIVIAADKYKTDLKNTVVLEYIDTKAGLTEGAIKLPMGKEKPEIFKVNK